MANICCVDHKVYISDDNVNKDSREELQRFFSMLERHSCEEHTGIKSALWCMVAELCGEDKARVYSCRSKIDGLNFNQSDCVIDIAESTAWYPCEEAWDAILDKFPNLSHAWVSAEHGCRLYRKVDEESLFDDRTYVVFSNAGEDEGEWAFGVEFATLDEWYKGLEALCGEHFEEGLAIEDLLDLAHASLTAKGYQFSVYSYDDGCEITDWSSNH